MNTQLISRNTQTFLECLPDDWRLDSEQKALDLVAACGENGTTRLMLHAESLTDDFYDLRSGLAGSMLLKFTNYHLQVAAVIPPEKIGSGRFYEMALETNRSREFRIFPTRPEAEDWLAGA